MDVKAKIEEIAGKLMGDEELKKQFQEDPVKTAEKLLGVDLPDDVMNKIVEGVKGKLAGDNVLDAVGKLKKLF